MADDLEEIYNRTSQELENNVKSGTNGNIINILTKFDWCVNYKNIIHNRLPAVYINEFRQNLSTFASSLKWGVLSLLPGSSTVEGRKAGENIVEKVNESNRSNTETDLGNSFNTNINNRPSLAPYKDMYSYTPTGMKYVFPYFETPAFSLSNSYGDEEQYGSSILGNPVREFFNNSGEWAVGGLAKFLGDMGSLTGFIGADSLSMKDKNIFIERPQFFQYDTSAETITVKFTLYNTITKDAWKQNYNFIKMFMFKNSPYKLSVFKYKTPVLYELTIPGVKYYPICYISSFSASNLGTSRIIENTTLVPEAWSIEMTFTSLLNRSGNLIQAATSGTNGIQNIITVSSTGNN